MGYKVKWLTQYTEHIHETFTGWPQFVLKCDRGARAGADWEEGFREEVYLMGDVENILHCQLKYELSWTIYN